MFKVVDQPGIGRFMMPGSPLEFRRHEREELRLAPNLGQHTDEILAEVPGLITGRIGEPRDGRRGRLATTSRQKLPPRAACPPSMVTTIPLR